MNQSYLRICANCTGRSYFNGLDLLTSNDNCAVSVLSKYVLCLTWHSVLIPKSPNDHCASITSCKKPRAFCILCIQFCMVPFCYTKMKRESPFSATMEETYTLFIKVCLAHVRYYHS